MKKIFLLVLTLTAGLLGASSSQAQLVDVNAGPNPNNLATGTFHVVITQTGTLTYQVTVTGNPDGSTPNSTPAGASPQKGGVGNITLFFPGNSFTALLGGTDPYGSEPIPAVPYDTNATDDEPLPFGTTGGVWNPVASSGWTVQGNYPLYVAPFGGNSFTGTFTASHSIGSGDKVSIGLNDGGENWGALATVTPEPGSLALILPGLAPLGFALRRRRRSSK